MPGHDRFFLDPVGRSGRGNLRRKHPDAQPILPSAGARPDIDFVQAVDDFDRWQASAEPDKWRSDIAHELRGLAQRYLDCLASKDSFRALWRLCDPGTGRLFERKGLQLKTYEEAARGFGTSIRIILARSA
ncbi:hypothetical protein [Mesorhizobium sp. B2-3-5]|uniref:hypothetical protein n=1 Tax=Mesorhizobium sp. B2-3-5 TaxID=2589958 RepID=UPI00112D04FF|nr:hypothetical protein [Mesorhizobium sp. B2-3-5]TPM25298.1 hypothetical protein FJ958_21550 [Mesorhizobium sp. B2-3-5]